MQIKMSHSSIIKAWLPVIVTAICIYIAGKLALSLSCPPSYATAIWPSAGIGLAALLLWGYRVLPGIFLAELLLNLEVCNIGDLLESPQQLPVFFISPVNSLIRATLGCILVKKFAYFPNELISARLIVLFFVLAGPVATFLPSVLSVYSLFLTGFINRQDLVYSFLTWWLGDCIGVAVFTPLFFICFDRSHKIWRQRLYSVSLPLTLLLVIVVVTYKIADHKEAERLQKFINHESQIVREDLQKDLQFHVTLLRLLKESGLQQNWSTESNDTQEILDPLALANLTTIDLGSPKWILQVAADKKYTGENYSWMVWQLLTGGMLITGFMSIGLLILTGQNRSVRSEVEKHTEEIKQSNSKLSTSEQQLRKLLQSLSAIVWRIDPVSMKFLFVNNEAETLLGYTVEQWLNEADFFMQHIHQDDKEIIQAFYKTGFKNQRDHEIEFRMIAADGRCVWVRNFIDVVVDKGEITEICGFMIDITEQKRMEEQLRLAATTFESQQGIMITDKNYKILQVNKAFTEITGFSQEQVLGKNPGILSSGQHDRDYYQDFWQQLTTYGKYEGEIWNRRENGEIYPEWQTVTAVKNKAGEVTHYVSVFFDITEKKETEEKINAMAFYDPLTNLPNRRLLLQRFDQELAIAKRHKQFGAVIYLDLDHFKLLNDSQGHQAGDELLIQVSKRLASALREEDTPARLGGDEFVVLLHATSASLTAVADHAMVVAEKIRVKLNEPFMLNQYQHHISPSIGIALFPENNKSSEAILQQADTAMYRSKGSGRNTINFFHPSMQEAADLRLTLEQDIRAAIEYGRFVLFYQPQVDDNGIVLGAEALIRWEHQNKGIILPVDFLSVAEESSLIIAIGHWVLLEACNQIKVWQDAGVNVPRIAVNVSSRQFRQKDFVGQVKYALETRGIAGHLLGIELTESVMIVDIEETVMKLKALKILGVTISVDHFGTGYCSLMCLKQLPIDVLKIDQVFIRDILTDGNDAVIVETIISMAEHLGLQVIATGVETAEQLVFLKQQGCQVFQGYYFSGPIYAVHFAEKYFVTDMKQA